jgi:hypothetical protein
MTDKIEEIRRRHEEGGIDKLPMAAFAEAHHDRAFLLVEVEQLTLQRDKAWAEVEHLRAENERLREVLVAMHIAAAEDGEVWITLALPSSETTVAAHLGSEQRLTGAVALLFEQIRRNALEAKP